jgi:hypothetical protein
MEPPSTPPPPPPPLNIPPSRARRQLAARLALHSKQNAENAAENGELSEKQARKNLNPFAADEDDDSDNDDGDFTIGNLEAEEEGKGHLPTDTGLVGNEETIAEPGKNTVGNPSNNDTHTLPSNSSNHQATRASFPSMWPFSNNILNSHSTGAKSFAVGHQHEKGDRNHFRGADDNVQSSDDNDSDSDEDGYGGSGREFGGDGQGKRRLSVTTEAKRRTSLEDDDEDEVVHVGMAEEAEPKTSEGDDGELVEIQHAEMQGVEGQSGK